MSPLRTVKLLLMYINRYNYDSCNSLKTQLCQKSNDLAICATKMTNIQEK